MSAGHGADPQHDAEDVQGPDEDCGVHDASRAVGTGARLSSNDGWRRDGARGKTPMTGPATVPLPDDRQLTDAEMLEAAQRFRDLLGSASGAA